MLSVKSFVSLFVFQEKTMASCRKIIKTFWKSKLKYLKRIIKGCLTLCAFLLRLWKNIMQKIVF